MAQWKSPHRHHNDDNEGSITEIRLTERDSSPNSVIGNHLYFYGEITLESVLTWGRQLDDVSKNMRIVQTTYDLASLSILGRIESLVKNGFEIYTIVEGGCASGATLISVGGSKRFIRNHSCMMIHQISSDFWGTYQQFQDEQKNIELMMRLVKEVYNKYTTLTNQDLNDILTHDLYLSVEECIKKGLVDQVL
jgi:hypothetical protein